MIASLLLAVATHATAAPTLHWATVDGTKTGLPTVGGTQFWQSVSGQNGVYVFTFAAPVKYVQASCFLDAGGWDAPSCVVSIMRDKSLKKVQVKTFHLDQVKGQQGDIHTALSQNPGSALISITADQ